LLRPPLRQAGEPINTHKIIWLPLGANYAPSFLRWSIIEGALMDTSRKDLIRHYFNPLHVFCLLNRILKRSGALAAARAYEKFLFKPFTLFLL